MPNAVRGAIYDRSRYPRYACFLSVDVDFISPMTCGSRPRARLCQSRAYSRVEKRNWAGLLGLAQLIVTCLGLGGAPEPYVYTAFEIRAHAHTTSLD